MGRLGRATLLALSVMLTPTAHAESETGPEVYRVGDLEIIDPWAKSAIGVHEARLFFQFRNTGEEDALIGAHASIAAGPTLLRLVTAGPEGRRVENLERIAVPAGSATFELTEVGYFVELTGLEVPLVMGSEFRATLHFDRAGPIEVPFTNRFHSPKLARRIEAAVERGDLEELRRLRDAAVPPAEPTAGPAAD